MKKRGRLVRSMLLMVLFCLLSFSYSYAQSAQITKGLDYLFSAQNADGSWGSDITDTEILPSTISVIETLQIFNQTGSQNYSSAISWLQQQGLETTDYLSERIHALSAAGSDRDLLLSYIDQTVHSWGGCDDYGVSNLDTAVALSALKKINYADQTVINNALNYLVSTQNPDGGWGFCSSADAGCGDGEGDSNVFMTSMVSITLQQFQITTSLATAINKATSHIIAHQNADGGFGSSSSTIYETAYAYIALVGVTTDNTVLGNSVNFLTSTQLSDGSWNDDPYSTALSLRALYMSENRPQPPIPPTTGAVTGTVIDGSTNQLLNGAAVVLQSDPTINTVTDSTGGFTLSDIPAGSQLISVSLPGYATASITLEIAAGATVNIGTIRLPLRPNSGTIRGTVVDASNGQPVQGVTITISGSYEGSATTSSDGSFTITDVTPGNITVTASKTGYYMVTGSGTVTAGGTLLFNPQMSTQPPASTTGALSGSVYDALSGQPIQGANVAISSGTSLTTDSLGAFQISDILPGTYQVTVSAPGYSSQSYQAIISAGTTTTLKAGLSAITQFTTVAGKVTDAATGQPIQGATVSVVGTTLSATTDASGKYVISGISLLEFFVKASASGHDSSFRTLKAQQYGTFTVDFSLKLSNVSDVRVDSFTTDKPSYGPKETVAIAAVIDNTGSVARDINYILQISSSTGKVMAIIMGQAESFLTLEPHSTGSVGVPWDTAQNPPDTYDISMIVADKATGSLLAESSTTFEIRSKVGIESVTPLISPMFVNVNEEDTIKISASLTCRSNVDSTLSAAFEVRDQDGTLLESGSVNFTMSGSDPSRVVDIGTFNSKFAHSGQYPVKISVSSGSDLLSSGSAMINVAPDIRIEPSKTLSPTSVTPDGDKRIHIDIHLRGVEVQQ